MPLYWSGLYLSALMAEEMSVLALAWVRWGVHLGSASFSAARAARGWRTPHPRRRGAEVSCHPCGARAARPRRSPDTRATRRRTAEVIPFPARTRGTVPRRG